MRTLLPTLAFALLAAPALASSIEPVTGNPAKATSIETVSCADCPPLKEKPKGETYFVAPIDPGTQKVEIREANGERKMFRTEAWMGGSAVVFVSKAPQEVVKTAETAVDADMGPTVIVDKDATTGALDIGTANTTVTAATSREFDPAGFELRIN
jgi:hypothetical protein